jgi:hypothetical protein
VPILLRCHTPLRVIRILDVRDASTIDTRGNPVSGIVAIRDRASERVVILAQVSGAIIFIVDDTVCRICDGGDSVVCVIRERESAAYGIGDGDQVPAGVGKNLRVPVPVGDLEQLPGW